MSWEDPLEKEMSTHSSVLIWKSHRQGSLACYSPRGHEELDMTRRLSKNKYFIVCIYIYHSFLVHSSVNGHLGYFHVLAIVNNAAMNVGCIYLSELVFSGYIPRSGIAESYGNYFYPIINPNIIVNLQ